MAALQAFLLFFPPREADIEPQKWLNSVAMTTIRRLPYNENL